MQVLDCRGLACPQPVLKTKEALDGLDLGEVQVIVDNPAARDNVTRFAQSQGAVVETAAQGADFVLTVSKTGPGRGAPAEVTGPTPQPAAAVPRVVVKVTGQYMGAGSEELGRVLMKAFLKTLSEATIKPRTLVFYNTGVHLTCAGSEHLDALGHLVQEGVEIISCGTCLDFFGLKEQLAVGRVTNMFEIVETLSGADRIVSP